MHDDSASPGIPSGLTQHLSYEQIPSMVLSLCRYMVRPTVGVVPSNESVNIKIYMVPQEKYTDELRGCKDRFLIHSIPVSTKAEIDLHKVFSGQGRQDFRLKVLVVSSCLDSAGRP